MNLKQKTISFLRWSEKYTQTDMIYVAKGGFWMTVEKVFLYLFSLATMTAFARWSLKEVYGAYQYIVSITAILAIFTLPGMNNALVRVIAQGYDKTILNGAKEKIKWGLIATIICSSIAAWYIIHQNFSLGISFLIAGLFLPFNRTFQLFQSFWRGKKRFDVRAKHLILFTFLKILFLIPVIYLTNNLIVIILAYFLSQTFFGAVFFYLAVKKAEKKGKEKETISFGRHLSLIEALGTFANQIEKTIIWQSMGPTSVAIYSLAKDPTFQIKQVTPISALALPKLSEKNIEDIKDGLLKKFYKLFLILFPAYPESIIYAQVLALDVIFYPFSLLKTSLVAKGKTKELYILQIVPPVLKIGLFLVLIPFYGIWGIIASILINEILSSGLIFYFFKKI
jgi:O-antigen/teichoic acid export membrane protein